MKDILQVFPTADWNFRKNISAACSRRRRLTISNGVMTLRIIMQARLTDRTQFLRQSTCLLSAAYSSSAAAR